jgi:hypothetical protein
MAKDNGDENRSKEIRIYHRVITSFCLSTRTQDGIDT